MIGGAQPADKLFIFPAFIYFFTDLDQHPGQLRSGDRLEQIFGHLIFQGLLGIFEFIITTENDDLNLRIFMIKEFAQLEAVHIWHTDISQNHIHLMALHIVPCLPAVGADRNQLISQLFPRNISAYSFSC